MALLRKSRFYSAWLRKQNGTYRFGLFLAMPMSGERHEARDARVVEGLDSPAQWICSSLQLKQYCATPEGLPQMTIRGLYPVADVSCRGVLRCTGIGKQAV